MEEIEQPQRKLPKNTIMFCEKPWQIPSLVLGLLVLVTFVWGFYIVGSHSEIEYFEESYELSAPEFMFRDMAGSDFPSIVNNVSPGVVGISGEGVNISPVATGVIVSSGGHVITVLHPLQGMKKISAHVNTPSGVKQFPAEVVKSLPDHNLVLIKILSPDRFLFFRLADTGTLQVGERLAAVGFGPNGNMISKEGRVLQMNSVLSAGARQLANLLSTDAVYSWEQNGGPSINMHGELLGINMSVIGDTAMVGGYAVPAHVIISHFGDVVGLKKAPPHPLMQPQNQVQGVNAAMPQQVFTAPPANPDAGRAGPDGRSSAWWAKARAQVAQNNPTLGMNIAVPNQSIASQMGAGTPTQMAANQQMASGATTAPVHTDTEHFGHAQIAGFFVKDMIALAALAMVVGIVSGMMTMGGGVLHVAGMMVFFGYGMHLIRPVAYLTSVFIFGAAARRNAASGLVDWETVKSVTPWAVIGVVAGYFIGNDLDDRSITLLLGLFAVLMTVKGMQEIFYHTDTDIMSKSDDGGVVAAKVAEEIDEVINFDVDDENGSNREKATNHPRSAILGLPAGLFSGILGISGGVIAVPMQRFLGATPLKTAIANSSVIVFWASLVGAIVSFMHGIPAGLIEWQAPLTLAAIMVPGAYVGGMIGAKLMKQLPALALKCCYTVIMAAVAIKMLFLH
jgi:serine protease Do